VENRKPVSEEQDTASQPASDDQAANITHVESKEMQWLADNNAYLKERLVGQWVAVSGYQLVAHGHDLGKVVEEAKSAGFDQPLLTRIRHRDPAVFHVPSFRLVE
jgi:hypothetical protein